MTEEQLTVLIESKANVAGFEQATVATNAIGNAHVTAAGHVQNFETRMKNAVIVTGEAGTLSEGLARKMNSLEQLGLTPASVGLIGLAGGAGLAAGAIKNLSERSQTLTDAYDQLNNAIEDNGYNHTVATTNLQSFLDTNRRYISDQAVVIDGYANMLRAGVPVNNLQRDLNLALDLSVARHKDLGAAIDAVTKAELGQTRGLVEMGVNVKDLNAKTVDITKDTSEYNKALLEVTKATDAHSTAVQKLADWESTHYGILTRTQAQYIQERDLKLKVTETTDALTKANQNAATAQQQLGTSVATTNAGLDQASAKYKDAHLNMSQLRQSEDDLKYSTDRLAIAWGPTLNNAMANGLDIMNLTGQAASALKGKLDALIATNPTKAGENIRNPNWGAQNNVGPGVPTNGGNSGFVPATPNSVTVYQNITGGDPSLIAQQVRANLGGLF